MNTRLGSALGNLKRGGGRLDALVTALISVRVECGNEFGPLLWGAARKVCGSQDEFSVGAQYFTCAMSNTLGRPMALSPLGVTFA